ncbi:MAG: hypothetical protein LBD60_03835 [Puniceicoccales bacterium]|jgi:hypothetical protein|nr:hypothetical protein [Puniceicoccales bacterium]
MMDLWSKREFRVCPSLGIRIYLKTAGSTSPKKALERLCGLMSSLYALEKAGIVHGDLHPLNLMAEKKKLPDEVIAAKVEVKARQMTGITREEKDLTEGNKRILLEAKAIAKANLTLEDQYEYVFRIIDFGRSYKINSDENPEIIFLNMMHLGTLIPVFLFGNKVYIT